eukprot:m.212807 g.212807  ORF g.212807 m.212807 type:complete len:327 (-) comp21613_c0_seq1:124-1104(-)
MKSEEKIHITVPTLSLADACGHELAEDKLGEGEGPAQDADRERDGALHKDALHIHAECSQAPAEVLVQHGLVHVHAVDAALIQEAQNPARHDEAALHGALGLRDDALDDEAKGDADGLAGIPQTHGDPLLVLGRDNLGQGRGDVGCGHLLQLLAHGAAERKDLGKVQAQSAKHREQTGPEAEAGLGDALGMDGAHEERDFARKELLAADLVHVGNAVVVVVSKVVLGIGLANILPLRPQVAQVALGNRPAGLAEGLDGDDESREVAAKEAEHGAVEGRGNAVGRDADQLVQVHVEDDHVGVQDVQDVGDDVHDGHKLEQDVCQPCG